ncbi:MAG TPA: response regulator transcription factor [Mycobacteriales bacterium]|nr:response regulator transcription factor [Mycobacteriales bacterium]
MAMRCLIVDDSARFLQAARALLEREGSVEVVGVASTSADAIARAEALSPDVLLLDIDLGGESGFELARAVDDRVRKGHFKEHTPRMILISTHSEEDFEELIEASPAVGFLNKSALSTRAIRELLSS